MDEFEKEMKDAFLEEAQELLENVEECFLELETRKDDPELLENIFRLAHNIKGSSAAVGFAELADFTHHVESFLLKIKDGEIPVESAVVDLLLQINDCLKQSVEGLREDFNFQYDYQEVIRGINALEQADHEKEEVKVKDEALVFENMESLEAADEEEPEEEVVVPVEVAPIKPNKPSSTSEENIRVGLARVDQLINIVGEMVILDTVLSKQHEKIDADGELKKTFSQMQKIIRELQDISMSFRMLPIKNSFKKMQRIIRDTSKALDKKINLQISGEDTEVDKTLLEKIADPLVHIVRNAADHGLETTEERLAAGKSAEGNLWLSAYHKGNFTVIEVRDDGAGIDPSVIRKKAVEKGLISEDQELTDEESIELIFAPGFSTKEQVTEVSGRGVGMDVVKTNIKELRGEVKISSVMGEGSVFKIYLPLTLAIVDGMVVHAGDHRFVVPISQITESVHATQIHSIGGRKEVLSLRGKSMALYRLSSLLGYSSNEEIFEKGIAMIVASEDKNKPFAVLVDDISEQQQVVIKPLSEEIKGLPGITGAAILGDGTPSPILDLAALAKSKFSKVRHKRKERKVA